MTTYLPALIWLLSGVVCHFIACRRHVKVSTLRAMAVALLGPLVIPYMLLAQPDGIKRC